MKSELNQYLELTGTMNKLFSYFPFGKIEFFSGVNNMSIHVWSIKLKCNINFKFIRNIHRIHKLYFSLN